MGYYIQTAEPCHKAGQLVSERGASRALKPETLAEIPEGEALVCVVQNGPFDAAALIYCDEELRAFGDPNDPRPREWLLMDKALAHELAGYPR